LPSDSRNPPSPPQHSFERQPIESKRLYELVTIYINRMFGLLRHWQRNGKTKPQACQSCSNPSKVFRRTQCISCKWRGHGPARHRIDRLSRLIARIDVACWLASWLVGGLIGAGWWAGTSAPPVFKYSCTSSY
jgi:hypothetical protein